MHTAYAFDQGSSRTRDPGFGRCAPGMIEPTSRVHHLWRPLHVRSRRVRRLGAPAREGAAPGRRRRARHAPRRRGRLVAGRGRGRPGRRLRLPARRQRDAPAGPAVAPAARGRARAVPPVRPGRPRVGRPRLDRPAARRRRRLRAAHRHVHARGHAGRRDRPARPPGPPRRRLRRAAAGQRVQRHPQLGLRRRPLVRGAGDLRRAGRLPAVRRRLPPAGPRRDPGRRLQPPRAVGELPARVLPDLRRGRRQHLGQLDQPDAARTPTRCAATSSTTR